MYVILGATGNTGAAVADNLLAAGQKVKVVGRSKERLARFAA
ncbi:MAG TPA: NAD(P)-binding domain-containing protein, partial [Candidatus Methylomirabilis sp.]|nr:NAD(P)-binding domain-containing protein [Candidatus Methylomirabilis sp.]